MSNFDDEFGGFEEATSSTTSNAPQTNASNKLPDWLLDTSVNTSNTTTSSKTSLQDANNNNLLDVKLLQDELSRTKELLLDQQTNYLQLQIQHRQELEESAQSNKKVLGDFRILLENALTKQREIMLADFRSYQIEQENRIKRFVVEINQKYEQQLNEKLEIKLVEFQNNLIKQCEESFEDMDNKMKQRIESSLKDEFVGDKLKAKQNFERLERDLKADMEKTIQTHFRNMSETYKEQIKSGVMQEHLIHKDLINSKLERLFKTSEEKRRRTQVLFARHLSGLNFFVDNASKQLGILKEAYKDLLNNKDIIDFYGEEPPGGVSSSKSDEKVGKENFSKFDLSSLSLAALGLNQSSKEESKNIQNQVDDEGLLDENLLQDLS